MQLLQVVNWLLSFCLSLGPKPRSQQSVVDFVFFFFFLRVAAAFLMIVISYWRYPGLSGDLQFKDIENSDVTGICKDWGKGAKL